MQIRFLSPANFSFLQLFLHNLIFILVIIPEFDAKVFYFFHEMM